MRETKITLNKNIFKAEKNEFSSQNFALHLVLCKRILQTLRIRKKSQIPTKVQTQQTDIVDVSILQTQSLFVSKRC